MGDFQQGGDCQMSIVVKGRNLAKILKMGFASPIPSPKTTLKNKTPPQCVEVVEIFESGERIK